jgi:hypothetical protein
MNPIRQQMGLSEPTEIQSMLSDLSHALKEAGEFDMMIALQEHVCSHDAGRIFTSFLGDFLHWAACCDCGKVLAEAEEA